MMFFGLALGAAWAGDDVAKEFVLVGGDIVSGVVIDEGDTAYLVRTATGVVRVRLADVADVRVLGAEAPPPSTPPATHVSVEGFSFGSAQAKADYDARRLELQVLDARIGTWSATVVQQNLGASTQLAREAGVYTDTVAAQYRVATGEGVVLAPFQGEWLVEGERLFSYMGKASEFARHGHYEGADEAALKRVSQRRAGGWGMALGGVALAVAGVLVGAESDSSGGRSAGGVTTVLGIGGIVGGAVWGATAPKLTAQRWVLAAWRVDEVMPHVRTWNEDIRRRWGVE